MGRGVWVLIVLVILIVAAWWLSRDQDTIPHAIRLDDTIQVSSGPAVEGGNAPILDGAEVSTIRQEVKPDFIGKAFPKCMSIIFAIQGSEVLKLEDNIEGIQMIEAMVKNRHHVLTFDNGICVIDSIVK